MLRAVIDGNFEGWRETARSALDQQIPPPQVRWHETRETQDLFSAIEDPIFEVKPIGHSVGISADFISLARICSFHGDPIKWATLYQVLWRLTHGEPHLLQIAVDAQVHRLETMRKEVSRDAHKMKAFVRFRKIEGAVPRYVAWYRPDHPIVRYVAPFFARRFSGMPWSILTSDESVHWDGESLQFGPGVPREQAPSEDELEDLWRQYYVAIFNPARIKIKAMKKEMPVRFWHNLPESRAIADLLRERPERVREMLIADKTSAEDFIPAKAAWPDLKNAIPNCRGCPLFRDATQAVFGEGKLTAKIVLVGEQPGNDEDLAGRPFVGPAGKLLDEALAAAGISRDAIYVTNAVKHFKFKPLGKRRLHQKPRDGEITACQPWLKREIELIKPEVIVCLGATAGRSVVGRLVRIEAERGNFFRSAMAPKTIITYHPSAILRAVTPESRQTLFHTLVADLKKIAPANVA